MVSLVCERLIDRMIRAEEIWYLRGWLQKTAYTFPWVDTLKKHYPSDEASSFNY